MGSGVPGLHGPEAQKEEEPQLSKKKPDPAREAAQGAEDAERASSRTIQMPVRLSVEEAERLKNIIWWMRVRSIQDFLYDALMEKMARMEKKHNHGKPFAQRDGEITKGRKP